MARLLLLEIPRGLVAGITNDDDEAAISEVRQSLPGCQGEWVDVVVTEDGTPALDC